MGFSVDRFDHIVINCTDVEVTAAWYARVLGMRVEQFGADARTALFFGDQKINLRPVGALGWVAARTEAAGSDDLCFVAKATPGQVRDHLLSCGVEIILGPVVRAGALGEMISHYCRDVDGNLVEIAVYPGEAATDSGMR